MSDKLWQLVGHLGVLRLKRELGERGLWVAGYINEVMAYIPSARMFKEGGYEVVTSMIYYF